jgi:hypothetical protein
MNSRWIVVIEPSIKCVQRQVVKSDVRASTVYANSEMNHLQKLECSLNCVYNIPVDCPWSQCCTLGLLQEHMPAGHGHLAWVTLAMAIASLLEEQVIHPPCHPHAGQHDKEGRHYGSCQCICSDAKHNVWPAPVQSIYRSNRVDRLIGLC